MSEPEINLVFEQINDISKNQDLQANIENQKEELKSENTEFNKMNYNYTEEEFSLQEAENGQINAEKLLAIKNQQHTTLLIRAANLSQENEAVKKSIKQKMQMLNSQKERIEKIRDKKRRDLEQAKYILTDRKNSLQATLAHQDIRIKDLKYILSLLTQLNSHPVQKVPEEVYIFQKHVTEQIERLRQNNRIQKIHCILQQQAIILDNLTSIRRQLNKE